ncbi:DUF1499 domain-containing protein [Neptunomonas japonica]|uniref:DUF1499 domain-containing protein n=1 Tax=Neptunomonas japonica JAMM 1380 TaxID=1441457 RepID=A0A7R6PBU8_9GAMM|nr:DUF1499 domain-containing protein [Neptunomonas japonica]BBB29619.1 conserved hypothetical protein [Neptunomonas japonica JAMM 1380]
MKLLLTLAVVVISAIIIYFFVLSYLSKQSSPLGLVDAKLTVCIQKPNCVCSEYPEDTSHFIEPVDLNVQGLRSHLSSMDVILTIKEAITDAGGKLQENQALHSEALYFAATFHSSLFGFIDDLEVRFDPKNNLLHFRSASRAGYSDFGVNRKRVMQLSDAIVRRLQ